LPRPLWLGLGTALFTLAGIGFTLWVSIYIPYQREQAIVAKIKARKGHFDTECILPEWVRSRLSKEQMEKLPIFQRVTTVGFRENATISDANLADLELDRLTKLDGLSLSGTRIGDDGSDHRVAR
jgi:hypothetical protein